MQRVLLILNVGLLLTVSTSCSQDKGNAEVDDNSEIEKTANSDPQLTSTVVGETVAVTSEIRTKPNTHQVLSGIAYRQQAAPSQHLFPGLEVKPEFESIEIPTKSDNGGTFDKSSYVNRELSEASFREEQVAFFGTCLQEYKSSTTDSPDLQAKVASFVERVIQKDYQFKHEFSWEELFQQGNAIVGDDLTKCDPVLLAYAGRCAAESKHSGRAKELLLMAIRKYADSKYASRHAVLAHRWMSQFFLGLTGDGNFRSTIQQNYINAVEHWLTRDLRATSREHQVVWRQISLFYEIIFQTSRVYVSASDGKQTPEFASRPILLEKVEKISGYPPWLLNMITGEHKLFLANSWRGAGTWDTLSQERRAMSLQYFQQAKTFFEKAYEINPHLPDPSRGMMIVGLHLGDQQLLEDYFQKAIAVQFDYADAYKMKLLSLEPKWGGSIPEIVRFARECAATKRYDTAVPFYLVKAKRILADNGVNSEPLSGEVLTTLKKIAENASDDEGEFTRSFYLTILAIEALYAGDTKLSFETLKSLRGKMDLDGYTFMSGTDDPGLVVGQIAAREAGRQAEAGGVARVFQHGKPSSEELAGIKQSLSHVNVDKVSSVEQVYWKTADKLLELYRGISSGQWMDLPFDDPQQLIWQYSRPSDWTKLENGIQSASWSQLTASVPFTPAQPFIFECDIDIVDHYGADYTVGIGLAPNKQHGRVFTINPKVNGVWIGGGVAKSLRFKWPMKQGKNRITLLALPGFYQMHVNGEIVHEALNDQFRIDAGGLYIQSAAKGSGVVQFSNARIRGWTSGFPPKEENVATRLKYYDRITKQDPSAVYAWYELGIVHLRKEEYAEAQKCFQAALDNGGNPDRVSLYMGEIFEAQGEWAKAVEAFKPAVISKEERDRHFDAILQHGATGSFAETATEEYRHDYRWRYCMKMAWILYFAPDDNVRNTTSADEAIANKGIFHNSDYPWLNARMEAASNFERNRQFSIRKLSEASIVNKAPENEKELAAAQQQAYVRGENYLIEKGMHILKYPPVGANDE